MPEENVSKALFEANAALNAQEFANRQILLKGDGAPNTLAPFGATYLDQTANPPKLYRQVGAGVANNWVEEGGAGGSGAGINGAVFITDIQPQNGNDNVGSKVFSSDGNVLDSAVSNTDFITVHILASIGHSNYKPVVNVEGQAVNLTQDEDQSIWIGTIDIDRQGQETLTATHEDGATHTVVITSDIGPTVESAVFTGGYPGAQTELKEGDTYQLQVTTDTPMTRIEVLDFGAGKAQVFDFAASTVETINVEIADRGNAAQLLGARIRTMNANGSYGPTFDTDSAGNNNGEHVLNLNNLHPVGLVDAVEYPDDQQAIKDSESAGVDLSASDYDTLIYESQNAQLSFSEPESFEAYKPATRIAGDYNTSEPNVRITLNRAANDATLVVTAVVNIAHVDPQITVAEPDTRLRSGGNHGTQAQNHVITVVSDQELLDPPVITAPHGTLLSQMVDQGNGMIFTQDLRVHDDNEKGTFQFGLTQAVNLAGKVVTEFTGEANYELGGFVQRVIAVEAFAKEIDLLVRVSDVSKVVARDKDLALLTYFNNLDDQEKAYTITGPSEQLNINGNLFHWNDVQAVNNNTTGLATITIEEVV